MGGAREIKYKRSKWAQLGRSEIIDQSVRPGTIIDQGSKIRLGGARKISDQRSKINAHLMLAAISSGVNEKPVTLYVRIEREEDWAARNWNEKWGFFGRNFGRKSEKRGTKKR